MKLSKPSCASILIASALLLNGVRSTSAQNLSGPSQSLSQQGNKAAQETETDAKTSASPARLEQTPAAINSPRGQPSAEIRANHGNNNPPELRKIGKWIANISAQEWTNFVITLATVFLAIFTGQLVWATRKMQAATEAALHVNRPFLLVTKVVSGETVHDGKGDQVWHRYLFKVHMRNFGLGPADIIDYIAGGGPHPAPKNIDQEIAPVWYAPHGRSLDDPLIAPQETVEDRIAIWIDLDSAMQRAVSRGESLLGIDGIIRYRGAPEQVYWTRFFWRCYLDPFGELTVIRRARGKGLNEHS